MSSRMALGRRQVAQEMTGWKMTSRTALLTICGFISADVLIFVRNGTSSPGLLAIVLSPLLLSLAAEDFIEQTLRRDFNTAAGVVAGIWLLLASLLHHSPRLIVAPLMEMVTAVALMTIVRLTSKGGLGAGDIRLIIPLSLLLEPLGAYALPFTVVIATLLGIFWILIEGSRSSELRSKRAPLGTFLIFGTWCTFLIGPHASALARP